MFQRLFIYYRIPKADIEKGLVCARALLDQLEKQGLGTGSLHQREEADKPYVTLMEVIQPANDQQADMAQFSLLVDQFAAACFSNLPVQPARHVELFTEVQAPCA